MIKTVFIILILATTIINAKKIAKIPEASGICFIPKTKNLIVVNDEGYIYRLSRGGKILQSAYLGKYNFEGVSYLESEDKLLVAVEDENKIYVISRKKFKILNKIPIKKKFKKTKILKKFTQSEFKNGLEAIAVCNGNIFLSNQSFIPWPEDQSSVVFQINSVKKKKKSKIVDIHTHGYIDISGLCFHKEYLYMLSDEKNLLIEYDFKNRKAIREIRLPDAAQEGICFDHKNNVYIADDNGYILKYKAKKLGL